MLEQLILNNNKLKILSKNYTNLNNLKWLFLINNKITSISSSLVSKKKINKLLSLYFALDINITTYSKNYYFKNKIIINNNKNIKRPYNCKLFIPLCYMEME